MARGLSGPIPIFFLCVSSPVLSSPSLIPFPCLLFFYSFVCLPLPSFCSIPSGVCHTLFLPFPQCLHPSLSSLSLQEGQVHRLLSPNMWRELIGSSVWLFPPDCLCVAVTWLSLPLLFLLLSALL